MNIKRFHINSYENEKAFRVDNSISQVNTHIMGHLGSDQMKVSWLAPVRMVIIAIIAFGYASTMPYGPGSAEYFKLFGYEPSWYGIQLIFMISGFLALRSLQRHGSAIKFLISRAVRNIPTLIVFTGILIMVLYPFFAVPIAEGETRFAQHIAYIFQVITCVNPNALTPGLLDNALYMCAIQGGLWTFKWGVIAFIVTAILWVIGGLRDRRFMALLTIGVTMLYAAFVALDVNNSGVVNEQILEFALLGFRLGWMYLVGMCMYAFKDVLSRSVAIPIALLMLAGMQFMLLPWTPFIEISADLGFGYLVFLAITSRIAVPITLARLPDLSLGLYVFNWPTTQITLLVMPSLTPYPLFAVSFPITVLLSYTTWLVVSRKININLSLRLETQSA